MAEEPTDAEAQYELDFQNDILAVCQKHKKTLAACVYSLAYFTEDQNIALVGNVVIPLKIEDHEDHLLRKACVKNVSNELQKLTLSVFKLKKESDPE